MKVVLTGDWGYREGDTMFYNKYKDRVLEVTPHLDLIFFTGEAVQDSRAWLGANWTNQYHWISST